MKDRTPLVTPLITAIALILGTLLGGWLTNMATDRQVSAELQWRQYEQRREVLTRFGIAFDDHITELQSVFDRVAGHPLFAPRDVEEAPPLTDLEPVLFSDAELRHSALAAQLVLPRDDRSEELFGRLPAELSRLRTIATDIMLYANFGPESVTELDGAIKELRTTQEELVIPLLHEILNEEAPSIGLLLHSDTKPPWDERRIAFSTLLMS